MTYLLWFITNLKNSLNKEKINFGKEITSSLTCGICLELVPLYYYSVACIRGLSRIFSRRGTLSSVLSNTDPYFTSEEIQQFCLLKLYSSWHALVGMRVYLRIIRSVKHCLKKVSWRNMIRYNELQTLLWEIDLVLNNMSLTFMHDTVLTPNHLLHGRWLNLQGIRSKKDSADINSRYQHVRLLY